MVRKLKEDEIALINWMINDTEEGRIILNGLEELIVEEMNDGGMGSLRVKGNENRLFSRELGKQFDGFDIDNVPVFISVFLDTNGDFFELDVFKGDFSPLKRFPSPPARCS